MKRYTKRKIIPIEDIPKKYFIENTDKKYKRWHDLIISRAKSRNILPEFYEIHHIVPISMGGTNEESNLVALTIKEHVLIHKLLVKIYPNSRPLILALVAMSLDNSKNYLRRDIKQKFFSSREVAELKIEAIKAKRGRKMSLEGRQNISKALKGKPKSEEAKKNLSIAAKNRVKKFGPSFKGKTHSDETKKLISNKAKQRIKDGGKINFKGEHHTEETKKIMSDKMKLRYKNGYRPPQIKRIIDPEGRIFESKADCAKFHGISPSAINQRMKRNPNCGFKFID